MGRGRARGLRAMRIENGGNQAGKALLDFRAARVDQLFPIAAGSAPPSELLHRHRLGEVARLIHVGAAHHGHVVGEQLQRHGEHRRGDEIAAGVDA